MSPVQYLGSFLALRNVSPLFFLMIYIQIRPTFYEYNPEGNKVADNEGIVFFLLTLYFKLPIHQGELSYRIIPIFLLTSTKFVHSCVS